MQAGLSRTDAFLFSLINQEWTSPWFDPVMELFSYVPLLWGIMTLVVILVVRRCWTASALVIERKQRLRKILMGCLLIACSAGLTETVTWSIKHYTNRLRPYQELAGTRYVSGGQWVRRPHDAPVKNKRGNSFVSGHSSNTMALANSLAYLYPPLRIAAYALPFCVGYSRVYLGKHYPSDALAGWLAGWALSSLICRTLGKRVTCLRKKRPRKVSVAWANIR